MSKRGRVEGRPKKFTDPKAMSDKIDEYFKWCDEQKEVIYSEKGPVKILYEPYTVSGLCLHLDMDRVTLIEYEKDAVFTHTVKKAKMKIENWIEKKSLNGVLNPTVSIFNLKNNFGWKDRTEVETTDATESKYEDWLKKNQEALKDITPETKKIKDD